MAIVTTQPTVTTTAALIASSSGASRSDPIFTTIKNPSAACFIGGTGLTLANGIPMGVTDVLNITQGPGDDIFAIITAATCTIGVLQTRR